MIEKSDEIIVEEQRQIKRRREPSRRVFPMADIKGERLYVRLGPSQVRKRLRGVGYGVRRVESAGTGRTLLIHTATGGHLEELKALFRDVLEREANEDRR